ncbi:hypothetical protein ANN_23581 [Periplaneta americana]|uniref:Transposable element Tc3 transposase n=1 Tax=Periplaneta americana TaxID=6978 RepID=A0ABQ8SLY1_PERAM|nr:hypothetical protein ANN_23581 [Periplaneta americana]
MASLCEGSNEPPGSLKASNSQVARDGLYEEALHYSALFSDKILKRSKAERRTESDKLESRGNFQSSQVVAVKGVEWFLQQCGVNPNFPALVLFTDEAQFTRDGITNFHNQHVWAYENPRATVPSHHQVRFSLNMWAGIIGDRLVGPHVLVNRLTGQAYTNFPENTIPHVLEDTPLINRQHIHFLHDGSPAHFSRTARRYLDRRFPDRWIGRGGPIAWPPRSPDLKPLDFYLWGHLKSLVYSSPVPDLESLRNRIVACSEDIRNTPGVWDRVRRSMRHRCEVCIQAGGGHFEHLL